MKRLLLAAMASVIASTALAEYPDKPITIVVPFAAGGPTDKVARDLAEALRKPLGNATIIIENVVGVGGTLPPPRSRRPLRTATRCCWPTPGCRRRPRSTARCSTERSTTSSTSAWSMKCR
jgi:hypothetical protein